MGKSTNRSTKKAKEHKKHESKYLNAVEIEEYQNIASRIKKNYNFNRISFSESYEIVNQPRREDYNQMKLWYEIANNSFKGNGLEGRV
jgi:hypothetical protein